MKKFTRKLTAMLMAIAMVLSFAFTAFAADPNPNTTAVTDGSGAKITVNNLKKGDGDPETNDRQTVNAYLIYTWDADNNQFKLNDGVTANPSAGLPATYPNTDGDNGECVNISSDAITALATSTANLPTPITQTTENETDTSVEFTSANGIVKGLYLITATDGSTSNAVTYSPMVARTYAYSTTDGSLTDGAAVINAKYGTTPLTKTEDDEDKTVYVGQELDYTVTGNVGNLAEYKIWDTLTGADFKSDSLTVVVTKVDGTKETVTASNDTITIDTSGTDITVGEKTFEDPIFAVTIDNGDHTYDGASVTITYKATVNEDAITKTVNNGVVNTAYDTNHNPGNGGKGVEVDHFTEQIKVTKYDDNDDNTKLIPLNGAKFALKKVKTKDDQENPTSFEYATLEKLEDGVYRVTGWVDTNDNTDALMASETTDNTAVTGCIMNLDDVSSATVLGVDAGDYVFEETKAPDGYTINTAGGKAKVTFTDSNSNGFCDKQAELSVSYPDSVKDDTSAVKDTKIPDLPSTGGMGTYIFTIGGVAIMVIAAAFLMYNRKKANQ